MNLLCLTVGRDANRKAAVANFSAGHFYNRMTYQKPLPESFSTFNT
jgi:hypothetical protein